MDYSFNGEIAKIYGVDEAVFIHNIYWWIAKNEANDKHFYDGKYWTYNSAESFAKLFPFWTKRQVERITKKLRDAGAVFTASYNKTTFDRTLWYALSDEVISIYTNSNVHVHECVHGNTQTVTPIPDINTDINTDSKPDICDTAEWKGFTEMRKQIKKPLTKRAITMALSTLEKLAPGDMEAQKQILDQSVFNCWKGLFELKDVAKSRDKPAPTPVSQSELEKYYGSAVKKP